MSREEAVEAAARALDPQAWDDLVWAALDPTGQSQAERQNTAREDAGVVIASAEAYLKAEALQEAAEYIKDVPGFRSFAFVLRQRAEDVLRAHRKEGA